MSPSWISSRRTTAARPRAGPPLVLALAVTMLTGCQSWFSQDSHPVFYISNESGQPVEIVFINQLGVESVIVTSIGPGQALSYDRLPATECLPATMVARSGGKEVGRTGPPLCRPGEWVIGGASPTP